MQRMIRVFAASLVAAAAGSATLAQQMQAQLWDGSGWSTPIATWSGAAPQAINVGFVGNQDVFLRISQTDGGATLTVEPITITEQQCLEHRR